MSHECNPSIQYANTGSLLEVQFWPRFQKKNLNQNPKNHTMKALFPEPIDIAKEILRRRVTFLSAYIRKNSDRPQIHNLMMLYWIL